MPHIHSHTLTYVHSHTLTLIHLQIHNAFVRDEKSAIKAFQEIDLFVSKLKTDQNWQDETVDFSLNVLNNVFFQVQKFLEASNEEIISDYKLTPEEETAETQKIIDQFSSFDFKKLESKLNEELIFSKLESK